MAMAFIFISTDIVVKQYGHLGFLFANVTIGIAWFSSPPCRSPGPGAHWGHVENAPQNNC